MNRILSLCFRLIIAIITVNPLSIEESKYILVKILDEDNHAGKTLDTAITAMLYNSKLIFLNQKSKL